MDKIEIEKFAKDYALELESYINSRKGVWTTFKLTQIKLDWSPHRVTSRGGWYTSGPGINLAMNRYGTVSKLKAFRVYEYASFDKDPVIGGFFTKDKNDGLRMIICHEVAHAAQFFFSRMKYIRTTAHDDIFKDEYRALRSRFLNHTLPNQEETAKVFAQQASQDLNNVAYSEL
jgi:hypothetical protein